jgi:hypothetical protein
MAVAPNLPSPGLARRRARRSLLTWVAVGCIAAVLIEVALFTNGFGLLAAKSTGGSTPPGPNPNPYEVNVTGLSSDLAYSGGGTNPFPALVDGQLCNRCPVAPKENANYSNLGSVLFIYFNVTNTGSNWTTLGNFTLTTSGTNPHLFTLQSITVGPSYNEPTTLTGFTPGQTKALLAFVSASTLPANGGVGYALTLHMTCP